MKINFIVKLSIIFCATTLMAAEKNQIIKKVVAYTKGQEIPTVEYIPVSYTHLTLPTKA